MFTQTERSWGLGLVIEERCGTSLTEVSDPLMGHNRHHPVKKCYLCTTVSYLQDIPTILGTEVESQRWEDVESTLTG